MSRTERLSYLLEVMNGLDQLKWLVAAVVIKVSAGQVFEGEVRKAHAFGIALHTLPEQGHDMWMAKRGEHPRFLLEIGAQLLFEPCVRHAAQRNVERFDDDQRLR